METKYFEKRSAESLTFFIFTYYYHKGKMHYLSDIVSKRHAYKLVNE